MDWRELEEKIDDYLVSRRWDENKCWIEPKRIKVKELIEIFETKF
jgi:hypothetical protein